MFVQTIIDDCLINYEILGQKNKEVVFIVHGWGRNLGDWKAVALNLAEKYKVILMDLPGHGASGMPPSQPFDTYDYSNTVTRFIKKYGNNKNILIGHSFGGKISVVVASQKGLISKLFLIDASGVDERNLMTKLQIFFYKKTKLFLKLLPDKAFSKIYQRIYKQAGSLTESFKKIVIQNVDSQAEKLRVPAIIIWGENDKEVTIAQAKKYRELIPGSTLRIIWGTGHHPHLEKPEKFLSTIFEYL